MNVYPSGNGFVAIQRDLKNGTFMVEEYRLRLSHVDSELKWEEMPVEVVVDRADEISTVPSTNACRETVSFKDIPDVIQEEFASTLGQVGQLGAEIHKEISNYE